MTRGLEPLFHHQWRPDFPDAGHRARRFNALAEGGQVTMPLDKTVWADAFGMLTDRFGPPRMVDGGMTSGQRT